MLGKSRIVREERSVRLLACFACTMFVAPVSTSCKRTSTPQVANEEVGHPSAADVNNDKQARAEGRVVTDIEIVPKTGKAAPPDPARDAVIPLVQAATRSAAKGARVEADALWGRAFRVISLTHPKALPATKILVLWNAAAYLAGA